VLGLLVAAAKSSNDTCRGELTQMAAGTILLDLILATMALKRHRFGLKLKFAVAGILEQIWPKMGQVRVALMRAPAIGAVFEL
jgi:hypothetical protein